MAIELGKTEAEKILFAIDQSWLDKRREDILEPDLPIIDPHHHLWDRGSRYLLDETEFVNGVAAAHEPVHDNH